LLAAGSFWALEVARRSGGDIPAETVRTEPDYYVENFNFIKIAANGKAEYIVSGERLVHYPANKISVVTRPIVKAFSESRPPMSVHARRAEVNDDQSEIHLREQVRLDRPQTRDSKELIVESEYMLVLPDADMIKTDKLVTAWLGNARLSGTGMIVDNSKQELLLQSKVSAHFLPNVAR
jgi:lipopolysaccharide export system protein LptC